MTSTVFTGSGKTLSDEKFYIARFELPVHLSFMVTGLGRMCDTTIVTILFHHPREDIVRYIVKYMDEGPDEDINRLLEPIMEILEKKLVDLGDGLGLYTDIEGEKVPLIAEKDISYKCALRYRYNRHKNYSKYVSGPVNAPEPYHLEVKTTPGGGKEIENVPGSVDSIEISIPFDPVLYIDLYRRALEFAKGIRGNPNLTHIDLIEFIKSQDNKLWTWPNLSDESDE